MRHVLITSVQSAKVAALWNNNIQSLDSQGNSYDFGFGLNWKGVIKDKRTATYKK